MKKYSKAEEEYIAKAQTALLNDDIDSAYEGELDLLNYRFLNGIRQTRQGVSIVPDYQCWYCSDNGDCRYCSPFFESDKVHWCGFRWGAHKGRPAECPKAELK